MTTLERSIVINATPAEIDAVTLDGNRLSEWYAGIHESRADAAYPEVGGTVEATYRAAGIAFKVKMTSIEWLRGHSISLRMSDSRHASLRQPWRARAFDKLLRALRACLVVSRFSF